jgi:hypothetical protein
MKFVARDVAEVEPDPTSATLPATLRATILEVDTRSNFAIAADDARSVASCVRTFRHHCN